MLMNSAPIAKSFVLQDQDIALSATNVLKDLTITVLGLTIVSVLEIMVCTCPLSALPGSSVSWLCASLWTVLEEESPRV